jgi:hypothetical protein
MTDSPPRCIFCRVPLAGDHPPSEEHVIPDALGGTLKITSVCKPCNSRLGREVDRLVDDDLFVALRQEARLALPNGRRAQAFYVDPDTGERVPVWLTPEGGFEEKSSITSRAGEITIRGGMLADIEEAKRAYEATLRERGKLVPTWGEPVITLDATPALIIVPKPGQPPMADRLDRLACKIALGFIAARAGSEVALDPRLDHIRSCVLDGRPNAATHHALRLAAGADTVFLPRVGRYFSFRAAGSHAAPDYAELQRRADAGEATGDLFPNAAPLTDLFHAVAFLRNDTRAAVRVILLGLFQIDVDIPTDLNVPWGSGAA